MNPALSLSGISGCASLTPGKGSPVLAGRAEPPSKVAVTAAIPESSSAQPVPQDLAGTVAPSAGAFSMAIGGCGSAVGAAAGAALSPAGFSDFPQAPAAAITAINTNRKTPRIGLLLARSSSRAEAFYPARGTMQPAAMAGSGAALRRLRLAGGVAAVTVLLVSVPGGNLAARLRGNLATLRHTAGIDLRARRLAGRGPAYDRRFFELVLAARSALPPGTKGIALFAPQIPEWGGRYLAIYELAPMPVVAAPDR